MRERIVKGADGSDVYVTIDGDMIDAIAHEYYGRHDRNTEAILAANPSLSRMPPVLPAGVAIKLPPFTPQVAPRAFRQLWN